jgi:hypothetical protein
MTLGGTVAAAVCLTMEQLGLFERLYTPIAPLGMNTHPVLCTS